MVNTYEPAVTPATETAGEWRTWIGGDDRVVELEVIEVVLPEYLLIIHVMPTRYRRKNR